MTQTTETSHSFIDHLIELRGRLLKAVVFVILVFACLAYFANDIYLWLATPIMQAIPQGATMIATDVASPFFTPFKLTFVVSIFVAIPYILHQIWAFIAPGLYQHEKRLVFPLLVSSTLLFYAGIAFAYYVVFPIVFPFFAGTALSEVQLAPDITSYLDFTLKMFFGFGLAFEIPVAILLMILTGMTTVESMREKRPYIVVSLFVIAMFLTPPDVISQVLLAVPMWLMFESALLIAVFYQSRSKEEEIQNESE
ncbi:twin-arginine translocase subunit TatC [Algicola sagamiensis]|uniref:twin-arginine translocase subunit TatC n=1 Tax=Algicola sagamiensis TaxID=163869 RepID=UPI00037195A6|nr:twin-arginine translocase subunit TatC [Algicola sagamiensis]